MNNRLRHLTAMLLALCLVFSLAACNNDNNPEENTTLDNVAPADDTWREAVPNAGKVKMPALTPAEIDALIASALGHGVDWQGDYATLTDAQRTILKAAFKRAGYTVEITDNGVVFDTESLVDLNGDDVETLIRQAVPDWDGSYAGFTAAQKEAIRTAFEQAGYAVEITLEGIVFKDPKTPEVSDVYKEPETVFKNPAADITLDRLNTFGSSGNDMLASVWATPDGGYAAVGIFGTADGDCKDASRSWSSTKSMIFKVGPTGDVEWRNFLGGDDRVKFDAVTRLAGGGYIAVGQTKASELGVKPANATVGLIVKYTEGGKQEWVKLVTGSKNEYFSAVSATPDGGFVIGGKAESSDGDFAGLKPDSIKAVLIKYTAAGDPLWKRALAGTMHSNVEGISVNKNGDIFATCITKSDDGDFAGIGGRGDFDSLVVKYDKNGNFQWINSFSGNGPDELTAVAVSPDGGCVIGGRYAIEGGRTDGSFEPYHNAGSYDAFLVKYNADGTIGWTRSIAGFKNEQVTGIAAVNGGYVVVGMTDSDNRDFAQLPPRGLQDGFAWLVNEKGDLVTVLPLAGSNEDVPRAVSSFDGIRVHIVGGTKSADHTFKDLSPAGGQTYIGFMATMSVSVSG